MQANRQGQRVALGGGVLQLGLIGLGVWLLMNQTVAAPAALSVLLAPLAMWLMTQVLFYCRFLQRREELELTELSLKGGSESIFTAEGEAEHERDEDLLQLQTDQQG